MRRSLLGMGLAAVLVLAACGKKEAPVAPAPEPTATVPSAPATTTDTGAAMTSIAPPVGESCSTDCGDGTKAETSCNAGEKAVCDCAATPKAKCDLPPPPVETTTPAPATDAKPTS